MRVTVTYKIKFIAKSLVGIFFLQTPRRKLQLTMPDLVLLNKKTVSSGLRVILNPKFQAPIYLIETYGLMASSISKLTSPCGSFSVSDKFWFISSSTFPAKSTSTSMPSSELFLTCQRLLNMAGTEILLPYSNPDQFCLKECNALTPQVHPTKHHTCWELDWFSCWQASKGISLGHCIISCNTSRLIFLLFIGKIPKNFETA